MDNIRAFVWFHTGLWSALFCLDPSRPHYIGGGGGDAAAAKSLQSCFLYFKRGREKVSLEQILFGINSLE